MPTFRSGLCAAFAVAAMALGAAALTPAPARAELDPKALVVVPFDKLDYKGQPNGPQVATVFGDSTKPGLYGQVIKWPPHTGSRPHSHPNERYITVLSGTWWVNTGAKYSPETMVPMKPGAFIIHRANEIHYDGTKDEPAMIYIVGMGPAPLVDREQK
jgi:quercetin dioxygenase-like cupin family protein